MGVGLDVTVQSGVTVGVFVMTTFTNWVASTVTTLVTTSVTWRVTWTVWMIGVGETGLLVGAALAQAAASKAIKTNKVAALVRG
jgi:general stress protein CsbA